MVIETSPYLDDGTPFPTIFWLTCPFLKEEISRVESGDEKIAIFKELHKNNSFLEKEKQSELFFAEYLRKRGFREVRYIGGSKKPLTLKCLHAYMAWGLVSHNDEVATRTRGHLSSSYCDERRCEKYYERGYGS
jgi:hypothetical protein